MNDLTYALEELLMRVSFELEQKVRVLGLRLEKYVEKCVQGFVAQVRERTLQMKKKISIPTFVYEKNVLPTCIKAGSYFVADFKKELSLFQSPKCFFKMNEKKQMEEAVEKKIRPFSQVYLSNEGHRLFSFFVQVFDKEIVRLKSEYSNHLKDGVKTMKMILQTPINVQSLEEKKEKIKQMIKVREV